ncbi:hypothetical protein INS49_000140 [Diaporthe citri]|uniref:uncharacterized protein n=1 Tax=Diaporthe citri TaxID=83186 RepID=UPI001C7EF1CA|nr:uncharacterized protein INS49_000140 [Diaporthe citri]KAG6365964.1 hypothetical protein INS49_000140 [Diaporthe citri]
MSIQQQRKDDDDDAVRNEDLEAYLNAEYDMSDDDDSDEGFEGRETDPLLEAGDRAKFTPSYNGSFRQQVIERWHLILEPRQKRRFNLVGPKCWGIGCVILGLILLAFVYLSSPVLKAMLFPEEQNGTAPVQRLT